MVVDGNGKRDKRDNEGKEGGARWQYRWLVDELVAVAW